MPEQVQEIPEKPVQPEIVSEIPQKKNSFKIVLLVVLGLLAAGGLVYAGMNIGKKQSPPEVVPPVTQPTPTPDPTANWKTYKSKCGLEFKYPPQWEVKPYFITDSDDACGYLQEPNYKAGLDSREGMYINLSRFLIGKDRINSLDEYTRTTEKLIEPKPSPIKSTDKTLGGFCGKVFSGYGYDPGISFIFTKGGYIYEVNRPEATPENYIDQILSTFKFLDEQNILSCTVDSDCGLNICACRAERKELILTKNKICARECPGELRCISGKCELI